MDNLLKQRASHAVREYDLLRGVRDLPAEAHLPKSRTTAVFLLVMAAAFAAFGIQGLWSYEGDVWPVVVPLGLALPIFLAGVHGLMSVKRYRFTREEVEFRGRGILGPERWSAPLSEYRGVLAK
ncbi:MAG: hypothetical protein R6X33_00775 [Candidatus Brocadiia bacterium]